MTEHRKSLRTIFRTPTTVSMATEQTHIARSYDLGIGGMCVITMVRLEIDDRCSVGFSIPVNNGNTRVSILARIAYSIPCAEGFKNGLQFTDIDADNAALLNRYLADQH